MAIGEDEIDALVTEFANKIGVSRVYSKVVCSIPKGGIAVDVIEEDKVATKNVLQQVLQTYKLT